MHKIFWFLTFLLLSNLDAKSAVLTSEKTDNKKQIKIASNTFEIIDFFLKQYTRPVTVLSIELDSNQECIFESALNYPQSTFVILKTADKFLDLLPLHPSLNLDDKLNNIIWLNRQLEQEDIFNLCSCEHFDIIIISKILLHFPNNWKNILAAFQSSSQTTIVELPFSEETFDKNILLKKIHLHLKAKAADLIKVSDPNQKAQEICYYILTNKAPFYLNKTTIVHPLKMDYRLFQIHSDYHQKSLTKFRLNEDLNELIYTDTMPWIPGINLITFLAFNGGYPSNHQIIKNLPLDLKHTDWMPNNMIIQGKKICLIDENDPDNNPQQGNCSNFCLSKLSLTKKFISQSSNKNPTQILENFIKFYGFAGYINIQNIQLDESVLKRNIPPIVLSQN